MYGINDYNKQRELATAIHMSCIRDEHPYTNLYNLYDNYGSCEFMEAVAEVIKGFANSWKWAEIEKLVHEVNRIEENEMFVSTLF